MKRWGVWMLAGVFLTALSACDSPAEIEDMRLAARGGDVADVMELLAANPSLVHAGGRDGRTPLHEAASCGRAAVAELLLSEGAHVDARADDGTTALHWAGAASWEKVAELLLRNGADVNARDKGGQTPLHWAAR